jgi:hypothetical protein
MLNDEIRVTLLREAHRLIDEAAESAIGRLTGIAGGKVDFETRSLAYPPSDGKGDAHLLSETEAAAIARFGESELTLRGLRKLIRDAASAPLFHFFCLLDGIGDPECLEGDNLWLGADLVAPRDGEARAMLHDDFFECYWDSIRRRSK